MIELKKLKCKEGSWPAEEHFCRSVICGPSSITCQILASLLQSSSPQISMGKEITSLSSLVQSIDHGAQYMLGV